MKSIKNKECGGIVKNLIHLKKEIEELIDEFNDFIKKWCGNSYPHLIDSDENDGEVFRDNIKLLFHKTQLQGYQLAVDDFEKMMPNANNTNPCMKCGSVQCARCGFDLLNEFDKLKSKLKDVQTK